MKIRLASPITLDSIVDGPGLRMVIWTQGCIHNCRGCHNPKTHNINKGYYVDLYEVIDEIKKSKIHRGITLSGGEPFLQPEVLAYVAKEAKLQRLDVWAYTGFTFEELVDKDNGLYRENIDLLNYIDILVDGKFEDEKKDISLKFRGSYNQRIIDIKRSLLEDRVVLSKTYMETIRCIAK